MTSRKLSNDQWTLVSALTHRNTLVTEDEKLHSAANDPALLNALGTELGIDTDRPILL